MSQSISITVGQLAENGYPAAHSVPVVTVPAEMDITTTDELRRAVLAAGLGNPA